MSKELFNGIDFSEVEHESGALRIEVRDGKTYINDRAYSQVHVHLGDATLLGALRSLSEPGIASVVIDTNAGVMRQLADRLERPEDMVNVLVGRKEYKELSRDLREPEILSAIEAEYSSVVEKAQSNLGNLYLIEGDILRQHAQYPVADLVTLFHPGPKDDLGGLMRYAAKITKTGGKIEFISENWMRADEAKEYAGRYVVGAGREEIGDLGFLQGSVHDIFLSHEYGYHHRVSMLKRDDRMGEYVYKKSRTGLETIQDTIRWARGKQ